MTLSKIITTTESVDPLRFSNVAKNFATALNNIKQLVLTRKVLQKNPNLILWRNEKNYPQEIQYENEVLKINSWEARANFMASCVRMINNGELEPEILFESVNWMSNYISSKMIGELLYFHPEVSPLAITSILIEYCLIPSHKKKFGQRKIIKAFYSHFHLETMSFFEGFSALLNKIQMPKFAPQNINLIEQWSKILFTKVTDRSVFKNDTSVFYLCTKALFIEPDIIYKTKIELKQHLIDDGQIYDFPETFMANLFQKISERGLVVKKVPADLFCTYFNAYQPDNDIRDPVKLALDDECVYVYSETEHLFSASLIECEFELESQLEYLYISSGDQHVKIYSKRKRDLRNCVAALKKKQQSLKNPKDYPTINNPLHFVKLCK